jgi:hypothetical protein
MTRRRVVTSLIALLMTFAPQLASACATCALSAYGDRGFNWGYGALLAAPFLVAAVVGIVLSWNAGYRLQWRRAVRPRATAIEPIPANEETT